MAAEQGWGALRRGQLIALSPAAASELPGAISTLLQLSHYSDIPLVYFSALELKQTTHVLEVRLLFVEYFIFSNYSIVTI